MTRIMVTALVACAMTGLIGYLLLVQGKFMWRLLAGGVLGALILMGVNAVGSLLDFSIAVNPFTAMAVGFLGVPGVAMIVALLLLM